MIKSIIIIVSGLVLHLSPIWAIVEFILYLVKDKEFNWWSVYLIPISLVVFAWAYLSNRDEYKEISSANKSGFSKRLEEIQNKRKTK